MEKEEWGPWIEHDGRGCPVLSGTWVRIQGDYPPDPEYFFEGEGFCSDGWAWNWSNIGKTTLSGNKCGRVIRYRIRKPRGMAILESLLQDLPQKVDA